MQRAIKFTSYASHPWLNKAYKKLKKDDIQLAQEFIERNDSLSKGEFELKINRMFLDRDKPKNAAVIMELLTCANSSVG